MLIAGDRFDDDGRALLKMRQRRFGDCLFVVCAFFVYAGKTREALMLAVKVHAHAVARDVHAQRIIKRGLHLAGQKA